MPLQSESHGGFERVRMMLLTASLPDISSNLSHPAALEHHYPPSRRILELMSQSCRPTRRLLIAQLGGSMSCPSPEHFRPPLTH